MVKSSDEGLSYWINLTNARGHAGGFATANTTGVTEIVELSVATEFAKAFGFVFGVKLENIAGNPHDPPDCIAEIDGRTVQIELVEMVDGQAIAMAKKTGRTAHNDVHQFEATQWDERRFVSKINSLIDQKQRRYQTKGREFECLLIYTGEPWLLPGDVSKWLSNNEFEHRDSFRSIYILMSYDPLYSQDHYPLFNIYGDLRPS